MALNGRQAGMLGDYSSFYANHMATVGNFQQIFVPLFHIPNFTLNEYKRFFGLQNFILPCDTYRNIYYFSTYFHPLVKTCRKTRSRKATLRKESNSNSFLSTIEISQIIILHDRQFFKKKKNQFRSNSNPRPSFESLAPRFSRRMYR